MNAYHGLSDVELANLSWRTFYAYYRGLLNREHSAYRVWRDDYLKDPSRYDVNEPQESTVTPLDVALAFNAVGIEDFIKETVS